MAGTRLTGLISGMDTESMISQLVEARKTKVTNKKKEQISLNYKQDKWKELNTKLKNLQGKFVSNLRFSTSYAKKTTKISNSAAASIITGEKAVDGVQTLRIEKLAKTGYLTGAQLRDGAEGYTALSKLSDLGFTGNGNITVATGNGKVDVSVTEETTISDVLTKLKEAGLNASFDEKNQRFFVSSKESGEKNDFSITASDAKGNDALAKLGLQVGSSDKATMDQYKTFAAYYVDGDREATLNNMRDRISADVDKQVASYLNQYKAAAQSKQAAQEKLDKLAEKYPDGLDKLETTEEYAEQIKAIEESLESGILTDEEKTTLTEQKKELEAKKADAESYAALTKTVENADKTMKDLTDNYITVTETDGEFTATEKVGDDGKGVLTKVAEDAYYARAEYAKSIIDNPGLLTASGATKVNAQDAVIYLNDAKFTNTTNNFEINGLTISALSETKPGEDVTLTTENDVSGIYDMVKSFIKEYNTVINEIDKLYNADSIGTMKPMTSEEKDAVTETEAKEWEEKLRAASLRKDSNLNTIGSTLKEVMNSGFSVGGKTLYLSNFGIEALSYFEAVDNEKNAFHIAGDSDDENTAGKADKLKSMIASDPNTVISFFTQLSQKLYEKMNALSKSVDGYRSFGNFYDDKKMKTDYDSYNSKIAELEKKLNKYEDSWYSKFAKMESTMAKMQKNTSGLSAFLGN